MANIKEDQELQKLIKKLEGMYPLFMELRDVAKVLGYKDVRSVKAMAHELDVFEDEIHGIQRLYYTESVAKYIHRNTMRGVIC